MTTARPVHTDPPRRTRAFDLEPPRVVERPAFIIAGMRERHSPETMEEIAGLWQRFMPRIDSVPGRIGKASYGACFNSGRHGTFDYMAGVEVGDTGPLPAPLTSLSIPPQRYGVFTHRGHVSTISRSWAEIFGRLLSEAGLQAIEGPSFERYDERFDSASGKGEVEIWVPVRS